MTILDIANLVGELTGVPVVPGQATDTVQKDLRNEPDRFLLEYWQPSTPLREGISQVIRAMSNPVK